uniref:IgGFc-binding protein-like n=1 Tax=Hippocampus comes TaxID=109280 RepID=A0A3Q2Z018_HIPCM
MCICSNPTFSPSPLLPMSEISSCDDLHCGHNKQCSFRNGHPLCSLKTKICSAWGDSYYRNFDGKHFVLLGNCNYTLVQTTCPGINASTPLQINIARAYLNGADVSSIYSVEIKIHGFNISMVKGERDQIRVRKRANVEGRREQKSDIRVVVLETSFGMTLQYDWVHNIQVEAHPELHGLVCGLCGNANDSISDDTITSNGTASKTMDFTLPWALESNTDACMEDYCGDGPCQLCSPTQSYPGIMGNPYENNCTLLKRKDGPFSDCHLYIDPEPFVRSCENNLCLSGAASSVCKVFGAYANICQRLGARIQNWRAIAKCHMACPINSHYEVCGSACQATCGNPDPSHNCGLPCLELCQCYRGYLLSNGKCVLPSECGCVQNGSYFLPTKTFWMDQQCQEKCVCQPQSKTIMCTQSHCQAGEVCMVLNGVIGCHAGRAGLCVAKGYPHYTTFDGRKFEVHGNCSYLLTSHCPTWGDLQDFSIKFQNHVKAGVNVSFQHVEMSVAGYSIEMSPEWRSKVMVNGLLLNLPSVLSQGKVMLYLKGQSECIETDFGVVVTYSPDILTVTMPEVFAGNLCGLCGNFNDDPQDDLVTDDFDITQAVRYWRTSSEHECWDIPMSTSGCSPQKQDLYQGKEFCGRLMNPLGAFQSCHKIVEPQDFYDNCVYDLCNGNQTTLCQILSRYVAVCQEMGAVVHEWRDSNFCSVTCPSKSEYHLCSTHMFACARNANPLSERCKEGCFCKPGFFQSGGECVPNSECGCNYNGVYYKIHENFYPDENCLRSCACVGHNIVQCRHHTCPARMKCVIKHGRRACHGSHLKCTVMGGRHFQTFQGHSFDLNMGILHHLLFQLCDEPELSASIYEGQLHLKIHDMNLTLSGEHFGKVEVNGFKCTKLFFLLPSGSLTHIIAADLSTVVTFGGPNLIQLTIPATHKRLCGLCQIGTTGATDDQGSMMSDDSMHTSSLCFSPTGTNCAVECHDCVLCNSITEFKSDGLCGMLLAPGGFFGICHSTVDPMPFFHNCVKDLCRSNDTETFCDSLRQYTFACQDAGAEVKPWRGDKCALSCPEHSHYNVCACPATCEAHLNSFCTEACVEGCQCDSGFLLDGGICITPSQCGCTYNGDHYHSNATFWADESCTQHCICNAYTHQIHCRDASCDEDQYCGIQNGVRSCVQHHYQMCRYTGHRVLTFDKREYNFLGTCRYQLLGICEQLPGLDVITVDVQADTYNQSQMVLVSINGQQRNMPFSANGTTLVFSMGLHIYVYSTFFFLSISKEGIVVINLSSKYADATCGLCGNFNSDLADDLTVNSTWEHLTPEQFGRAWRLGQNRGCVEGCLGGSCPNCSSEALHPFSDPVACGKILEVNGPFRHCHSKVDPSSFYKSCVSDLCLYGDVQPAVCRSLAEYADVCLHHKALVYAWRSSEFCCDNSPVDICLDWLNLTIQVPPNIGENCLCGAGLVHSGRNCVNPANCGCWHGNSEYILPGQEKSTCEQRCLCHPGGNLTCVDVSCSQEEECTLIGGILGCHPKVKMANCYINGSQLSTFDGYLYEFRGSCNYILVQTCKDLTMEPLMITINGNQSEVIRLILFFFLPTPQVNEIYENLPFSRNNVTVHQKNEWRTVKVGHLVEITSDLGNYVAVKLPKAYHQTTCGLCGNYNDDPSDDMQLPNGTTVSDPDIFGQSWKLSGSESSCSETCDSTCQRCRSPVPEYTSNLYCGLLTQPKGPFSSCHNSTCPQNYYTQCLNNLCVAEGEKQALCEALEVYDAACKVAGTNKISAFLACVQGCFCNPGFINSPEGCVPPKQCGCTDPRGKYHRLKSTFWIPDDCGQLCICKSGEPKCSLSRCPKGMSCKQLPDKRMCQADKPQNCSIVTGMHFTTFDGHSYDFRDSCAYVLVQATTNINGSEPFNITISDASDSDKVLVSTRSPYTFKYYRGNYNFHFEFFCPQVNGLHKPLPYSHHTGHFTAYQTPSSLVIHVDMGLQVTVYKTGTVMVGLPSSYESFVRGLCGNANSDPYDDQIMPDEEEAQNTLEFVHSWRLGGAMACRSRCTSRPKNCPADARKRFEGTNFCGILRDEFGPFAECLLVLSPKLYFHNCLADACFYGGHYLALCNSITAFAAACQAAQLPIRHWRSDTFCGMTCPKNSHYELCGPRCPVVCEGLSSATKCSGGCEEGCQCDPGFVLRNDRCVLVADCGCFYEGQYHPAGYFSEPKNCRICYCREGKVTCRPSLCRPKEPFLSSDGLFEPTPRHHGACEVFAGFGYVTFDGLVIRHHGACTFLVSERSPKDIHGHSLLLSFEEGVDDSVFTVSKVEFILAAVEITINPEAPWKIQVSSAA